MTRAWLVALAACHAGPAAQPPAPHNVSTGPASRPADAAPPFVFADDPDCTLNPESIVGKLRHDAPGVTTPAPDRHEDRHVTEQIVLSDGTHVTFSIGGCEHFGWTLEFVVPAIASDPFSAAAALIAKTPMKDHFADDMIPKLGMAKLAAKPQGPWPLDCGQDTTCELDMTTDRLGVHLTISYDFPL